MSEWAPLDWFNYELRSENRVKDVYPKSSDVYPKSSPKSSAPDFCTECGSGLGTWEGESVCSYKQCVAYRRPVDGSDIVRTKPISATNHYPKSSLGNMETKIESSSKSPSPLVANSILDEAKAIVDGARQANYGPPERSFDYIASLWSTYLANAAPSGLLTSKDVALMMILMKVARELGTAKRDNLVDIAGYAYCAELCEKKE